jgi:hypothetical protein
VSLTFLTSTFCLCIDVCASEFSANVAILLIDPTVNRNNLNGSQKQVLTIRGVCRANRPSVPLRSGSALHFPATSNRTDCHCVESVAVKTVGEPLC